MNFSRLYFFCIIVFSGLFTICEERIKGYGSFATSLASPTPYLKSRIELLKLLPKNGIVAEIGVWRGEFSSKILEHCNPKHLYLIDGWAHQNPDLYNSGFNLNDEVLEKEYQAVVLKFKNDPRVTIVRAFSPEAVELFENNFFDWVYLDGNHNYHAIKQDLYTWYEKVKVGGLIVGDDYNNTVSSQVVPAVNEFLSKYNLPLLYLTTQKPPNYAFVKNEIIVDLEN